MKIKTLPQIVKAVKAYDADTALNESMLSDLIASGCLPFEKRGNRTVADFDTAMMCLNQMLGLEATNAIPRLRTIRGAARDIKSNEPELGIGEEQIRAAVDDERIDFIRIGNRAYIALELFEEPYIQHFTQIRFDRTERRRKADSSALAQIGLLISGSKGIPTVKRIRKTA